MLCNSSLRGWARQLAVGLGMSPVLRDARPAAEKMQHTTKSGSGLTRVTVVDYCERRFMSHPTSHGPQCKWRALQTWQLHKAVHAPIKYKYNTKIKYK